jgi:hypothetical protein
MVAASKYSGLQKVLNALAGTTGCGPALAANVWAGSKGLSLVGALNYKNGWRSGNQAPGTYLGLEAVCNAIAGTSGLGAVHALNIKAGLGS